MSDFADALLREKTVLVTGASSGIGRAFAQRASAHGARLVLVARRTDVLSTFAKELHASHGTDVRVISGDLSRPGAGTTLFNDVVAQGLSVDVLVNNAGVGAHGDLVTANSADIVSQIQLNVTTLAELTTLFLPAMTARGSGTVINIASTAAFQPIPHMAVYGATKAFVLSFTRALWAETKPTGVRVIAVCPGATDTEFFDIVGDAASVGRRRNPDDVVNTALRALHRHRPSVVDGFSNAAVAAVSTRLPARVAIAAAERSVRP
ncbi:SDR family NAD(P)-dependent oxidoreductase [Gordonia sp. 852002-10350_SCH5691597]|uniref:SDR family NAD(P)-dependent oxidoreductase n=1 Tax=Gordonia sp. 852002-10350_SCH5691597 TaxID=1834085 RepID=UPI0007EB76C5|nr:SDR family oxidoreductase [Gordonia sp. 852002-10350_SCH5691597]OBA72691.1 oxidoreductase [Gordonia sp. 852002-10350_SCH5691597]